MAVYVQPLIGRADYKAFKSLMPNDSNLPDTYNEWLKDQAADHSKMINDGSLVQEIPVDPDEFVRYCRAIGTVTDSAALGAFTVAKVIKQKY
jgi:hypothetical protein